MLSSDPELAWTAIDIDPHMTQATGTRLREFPERFGRKLPTPPRCRSPTIPSTPWSSCLMLHHIIDWERAVAEVARVLRPGGTFVGYDLLRTPLASLFHRLDGSPHRLLVPDDFRAECARNGLKVQLQSELPWTCRCASSRLRTRRKSDGTIEYSCEI